MNLHIENSINFKDVNVIRSIVTSQWYGNMLSHNRSIESYVHEWVAHNWLYEKGLFVSHTKDVDLNDDEKWYRRLVYFVIYLLFRP